MIDPQGSSSLNRTVMKAVKSPASLISKNSIWSQSGRLWQQFVRAHVRVKDLYDTFDECQ